MKNEIKKQIIKAPKQAKYLSDFLTDLPKGIFNKKQTNVGGTHLALTHPENYIIIAPTVELIKNKVENQANLPYPVFGLYADVPNSDFREYIRKNEVHHIMVTYDSLPKLIRWLAALDIDAYTYNALLDEYHLTLLTMGYRERAIVGMMEHITKFSHYTLMSATPVADEFVPQVLKEMDYTEVEWENNLILKPQRIRTPNPYAVAANIIEMYKEGEIWLDVDGISVQSEEGFFFLNSVKGIKNIIDRAELTPDEVKIVCSDTLRNRETLGSEFKISGSLSENRKFTFITSKAFEGSDFFSQTGVVYVISDAKRKHTLIDIQTQLYQCAGRIRTESNPFRTKLFHIYSTGYATQTKDDFDKEQQERIQHSKVIIDTQNKATKEIRLAYRPRLSKDLESDFILYNEEEDRYEYNEIKEKFAEFAFNLTNSIYKNGLALRKAYSEAGVDAGDEGYVYADEFDDQDFIKSVSTSSFKDLLIHYCHLRDMQLLYDERELIKQYEREYPKFKYYYERLTSAEISTCKYVERALDEKIYSKSPQVKNAVAKEVFLAFKLNLFYSLKDAKQMLKDIYKKVGSKASAKSTDLSAYFEVENTARRLDDKRVDGLVLTRRK
ncbi:DEAD/DEAH box helicase family protein [Hymenobacter chitinivorans]|uniref:RAD3-like DEAD/DEAH box helicase n=1 Tax=Hymenobacter chitinivorans DSM 11115 TaxID=1121954 RepID=A0A2M9AT44_9BACT|nr:DEAD/DEAH box helicase family protein [Hymenobacter chitinivorans]PJJ48813.1 hypothetical protein CLV45_4525 [Hymenobacter chitinivorans DSM 11115]